MWKSTNVDPTEAGTAGAGYKSMAWRERRVDPWALSRPPAGVGHSETLLCFEQLQVTTVELHV